MAIAKGAMRRTADTQQIPSTDPKTRSIELATEHGQTTCSHAAKTLGWTRDETSGALISLALTITSATSDGEVYTVGYRAATDDAECECAAAAHGRPCWHRGLAILCGREVARLYTPTQRIQAARDVHTDHAHEAFACAMGYAHEYSRRSCGAQPIAREAW